MRARNQLSVCSRGSPTAPKKLRGHSVKLGAQVQNGTSLIMKCEARSLNKIARKRFFGLRAFKRIIIDGSIPKMKALSLKLSEL